MLEVCIDSLESALNAIHGGADEIEVCSSLAEGGLTPSLGLVKLIQHSLNNIKLKKKIHESCPEQCSCVKINKIPKVNVMLRCRTGSDFCYNTFEMDTMVTDLEIFKSYKVDRFVFGAMQKDQVIDQDSCKIIIEKAKPIPVTFHRAFDLCKYPTKSLETIIDLGFNRLLTSGQRPSAIHDEAINLIKELIKNSKHRIDIMPGAGVTYENANIFINIGCKIVHSSCKKIIELPRFDNISMGSNENSFLIVTDESSVRKLKAAIFDVCN